jgi:FPC/CPF motif-containing protein YcgG
MRLWRFPVAFFDEKMQSSLHRAGRFLEDGALKATFTDFVQHPSFPCLGARAAFNAGAQTITIYQKLASVRSTKLLARQLEAFVHAEVTARTTYATYIAIFREPRGVSEEDFEKLLWRQLRSLHRIDAGRHAWDASVASDPADARFSFSFAGKALYVVGLHAGGSRLARRFPWPTLVFNPHEQFERIRHDGKWRRMQRAIRSRDRALQGSINPMLSDFGETSEARQYSGRIVKENWQAPFRPANSEDGKSRCPFAH